MKEIWKDVPGYEGIYQVSNLGNVKSLERIIYIVGKYPFKKDEKTMKLCFDKNYKCIVLTKNGKHKKFKVHQLVAMSFLNHKPCGFKIVVDHINNNPLDNRLENLQLITHRENTSKDLKNNTSKYTGVHWRKDRQKWRSQIHINNKTISLGLFEKEEDAHSAYLNKLSLISN